jgi:fluoride exporter
MTVLWIMLGGAVGTGLRYGVGQSVGGANQFPIGTMTVNLLGCLLIGALATLFSQMADLSETLRLAILVGFLGGFTTFSSFGLDTLRLLESGRIGAAVTYVVISNGVGVFAVWFGAVATQKLSS